MRRISKAETRRTLIDPALERAGWRLKNHVQVGLEIPVDSYDKEPWNEVTDRGKTWEVLHSMIAP